MKKILLAYLLKPARLTWDDFTFDWVRSVTVVIMELFSLTITLNLFPMKNVLFLSYIMCLEHKIKKRHQGIVEKMQTLRTSVPAYIFSC